jgi:hypothetical protein
MSCDSGLHLTRKDQGRSRSRTERTEPVLAARSNLAVHSKVDKDHVRTRARDDACGDFHGAGDGRSAEPTSVGVTGCVATAPSERPSRF